MARGILTSKQIAAIPNEEWERVHGCTKGSERQKLLEAGYLRDYESSLHFLERLAEMFPDNEGIRQTLAEWRSGGTLR
jgi:hypothetical protein